MAQITWKQRILSGLTLHNELARALLSECYATFILSVVVHGAIAQDTVSRTGSAFNVSFTVGMGIILAIYTSFGVSGGHVNLALSVGTATIGIFPWRRVPLYFMAQVAGGFVGAGVVYMVYLDAFNAFDGGTRQAFGENGTAAIFATFPQPYLSVTTGFFEQVLNTGLLLATIGPVLDHRNNAPPLSLAPFFFGLIVFTILMSYGYNAGAPLNPSVDLSGRLFLAVVGYGQEVWIPGGVHWWWVPIVAPAVGAALGSLTYFFAISLHHPPLEERKQSLQHSDIELTDSRKHTSKSPDTTRKPSFVDKEIGHGIEDEELGSLCENVLCNDTLLKVETENAYL